MPEIQAEKKKQRKQRTLNKINKQNAVAEEKNKTLKQLSK